jgi:DNA-3-methyladenine glycosylase II
MRKLDDDTSLQEAVMALLRIEPRFGTILDAHGFPPLRRVPEGWQSLLRIVTDQLISLQAGEAIWGRLTQALAPLSAARLAAMSEEEFMQLGLSRAKARCFRMIAAAQACGGLDPSVFRDMTDEAVVRTLTALRGIGPWTAQIYLLTAMGRPDAWPSGDLALQAAAQHLFALTARPGAPAMTRLAEPWRPWRAAAARLLWSHYRGLKGLPQTTA